MPGIYYDAGPGRPDLAIGRVEPEWTEFATPRPFPVAAAIHTNSVHPRALVSLQGMMERSSFPWDAPPHPHLEGDVAAFFEGGEEYWRLRASEPRSYAGGDDPELEAYEKLSLQGRGAPNWHALGANAVKTYNYALPREFQQAVNFFFEHIVGEATVRSRLMRLPPPSLSSPTDTNAGPPTYERGPDAHILGLLMALDARDAAGAGALLYLREQITAAGAFSYGANAWLPAMLNTRSGPAVKTVPLVYLTDRRVMQYGESTGFFTRQRPVRGVGSALNAAYLPEVAAATHTLKATSAAHHGTAALALTLYGAATPEHIGLARARLRAEGPIHPKLLAEYRLPPGECRPIALDISQYDTYVPHQLKMAAWGVAQRLAQPAADVAGWRLAFPSESNVEVLWHGGLLAPPLRKGALASVWPQVGQINSGARDTSLLGTLINLLVQLTAYIALLGLDEVTSCWKRGWFRIYVWGDDSLAYVPLGWPTADQLAGWIMKNTPLRAVTGGENEVFLQMLVGYLSGKPGYMLGMRQYQNGNGGEDIPETVTAWAASFGARVVASGGRITHVDALFRSLLKIPGARYFGRTPEELRAACVAEFERAPIVEAGHAVATALAQAGIRDDLLPLRFTGFQEEFTRLGALGVARETLWRTVRECIQEADLAPFTTSPTFRGLRKYHRTETKHVNIFE